MTKRRRPWIILLVFLGVAGLAGGFLVWRQRQPGVVVTLEPPFTSLGHPARTVRLRAVASAASLESVEVRLIQDGKSRAVLTEDLRGLATRQADRPLVLEVRALELTEGPAELQVLARDALWRPRPDPAPRLVHRFTVDLTPPTVELRSATRYITHGGAGIVVYRVAGAARSGVQVGEASFSGVSGLATDPSVEVALFVVPYNGPQASPKVFAEDDAGNRREIGVPVTLLPTRFPKDTIRLTEAFLARKVPELAPQTPGTASPQEILEAFLRVNREGRKGNEATIRDVTRTGSAAKPLWQGVFRQQPNTKVFANYPEERTYEADGRVVDTQWHLGIDLASRRQSPVEAANAGRVVFTAPNGIFGNLVILDHGLGLFTLYAHLSEIAVKTGQSVAMGETLGRSGETGLAGGDHLHFGVLIDGVYTNPLEWWDGDWIRERIARPLTEAGIGVPGITDGALAPAPPTAPLRRAPRGVRRPGR